MTVSFTNRTAEYAKAIRLFSADVPKTLATVDDLKQLIQASVSLGATHLETEVVQNRREFIGCMKSCRKDARECLFWLRQIEPALHEALRDEYKKLEDETTALLRIFTSCINSK